MKHQINYKLLIGIPLLAIAVGGATILLLSKFAPQNKSLSNPTTTVNIPEPADIIKQYQQSGTIGELTNLYTKKTEPVTGLNTINYTADKSYTVYLTATNFVQFEQKDKTTLKNSATIKISSEAFLKKTGLSKQTNPAAGEAPLFAIFDSTKTVCQLVDLPPTSGSGALLGLACLKKAIVNDQYTTINKLLALYGGDKSAITNPTAIRLTKVSEGNKSLSMTDIYGVGTDKTATSLVFAAIDNKWEYLGQRALSAGDTATDQNIVNRTISGDLKAKINDPKYEGFLKKYIQ